MRRNLKNFFKFHSGLVDGAKLCGKNCCRRIEGIEEAHHFTHISSPKMRYNVLSEYLMLMILGM